MKYPAQPWYYLALMGLGAMSLDTILSPLLRNTWGQLIQVGAAAVIVILSVAPASGGWRTGAPITNVDLIASHLEQQAKADDLIVISPWYLGITFNHYYRGDAAWTTLPAIEDPRVHRYDLLKQKMTSPGPIQPVLDQVGRTLRSGHRVWLVRMNEPLPRGAQPTRLPIAPLGSHGWASNPYLHAWSEQLDQMLQRHAGSLVDHPIEGAGPMGGLEHAGVQLASPRRG